MVVVENNASAGAVFIEFYGFAFGENCNTESVGEVFGEIVTSFSFFMRKNAIGHFKNDDFTAEFGIEFGDFAAG